MYVWYFSVGVICLMFYLIEYEIATSLHGNIFQCAHAIQTYLVYLIPATLVHSFARFSVNLQIDKKIK